MKTHRQETLEAAALMAARLIKEIQKRDGEGNTIPAHTYLGLVSLLRELGIEVSR